MLIVALFRLEPESIYVGDPLLFKDLKVWGCDVAQWWSACLACARSWVLSPAPNTQNL